MSSKSPMDCMMVQRQIRANAEEMQDYLSELKQWEKTMEKKDKEVRTRRRQHQEQQQTRVRQQQAPAPIRPSCGTVGVQSSSTSSSSAPLLGLNGKNKSQSATASQARKSKQAAGRRKKKGDTGSSAAAHTYDKGYAKWEKFDVDAALADSSSSSSEEEEDDREEDPESAPSSVGSDGVEMTGKDEDEQQPAVLVTPATITAEASRFQVDRSKVVKPRPRTQTDADMEMAEREKGNEHYRRGEFAQAVRCYTRCIGFNNKSAVSFSNRAMAYLKLREFTKADQDATIALANDPTHVKSLHRRATARSSRGMYRAALVDLEAALALQPPGGSRRELAVELRKTKEMFRASIRRAPKTSVPIHIVASPALPPPPSEKADSTSTESGPIAKEQEATEDLAPINSSAGDSDGSKKKGRPAPPDLFASLSSPPPPAAAASGQEDKAPAIRDGGLDGAPAACQQQPPQQPPPLPSKEGLAAPTVTTAPFASSSDVALKASTTSASATPTKSQVTTKKKKLTGPAVASVTPKNLYELQRKWRMLGGGGGGDEVRSRRVRYLREAVRPGGLARVLGGCGATMEPDLLAEVIDAIDYYYYHHGSKEGGAGEGEEDEVVSWLGAVSRGGSMAMMLLDAQAKAALQRLVSRVERAQGDKEKQVLQLRRDLGLPLDS